MSNLATISVQPSTEYQNLATLAGITFSAGMTYVLQIDGNVRLCEAAQKPTSGGFRVFNEMPIQFEAGSDPLWVKNLSQSHVAYINIAD